MSTFKKDLALAEKIEIEIQKFYPGSSLAPKGQRFDGDLWVEGEGDTRLLTEVKSHPTSKDSNKVAFEFYSFYDWTPRGIASSKADLWVDVMWDKECNSWIAVENKPQDLRDLLSGLFSARKLYCMVRGDMNCMGMVLVNCKTIKKLGRVLGVVDKVLFQV